MDAFGYLSVLLSIVLGLGLTQLLAALGRLIRGRARVRFDWVPLVLAATLFVIFVQMWWSTFGMRLRAHWTFLEFLVVLLQSVLMYMAAALALPETVDEPSDEGGAERASAGVADLRAHYERQAPWLYGFLVAMLLTSLAKDVVINGGLPAPANVVFHVAFITAFVAGAAIRRRRFHEGLVLALAVAIAGYIVGMFWTLR